MYLNNTKCELIADSVLLLPSESGVHRFAEFLFHRHFFKTVEEVRSSCDCLELLHREKILPLCEKIQNEMSTENDRVE